MYIITGHRSVLEKKTNLGRNYCILIRQMLHMDMDMTQIRLIQVRVNTVRIYMFFLPTMCFAKYFPEHETLKFKIQYLVQYLFHHTLLQVIYLQNSPIE